MDLECSKFQNSQCFVDQTDYVYRYCHEISILRAQQRAQNVLNKMGLPFPICK